MLVSVNELRRYMGGITPHEGMMEEMANVLMGVQEELEAYLNRPVEIVQVREIARSDSKGFLYLSESPVHRVLSYGVSVVPQNPNFEYQDKPVITRDPSLSADNRLWDKSATNLKGGPLVVPGGLCTGSPNTYYEVEYLAGLDGRSIHAIKSAIKRVAAREWSTNHIDTIGLRTGIPEGTEVGDQRSIGWARDELSRLQRYRRRIAKRS